MKFGYIFALAAILPLSNVQSAVVNALTLVHPESQQTIIIFGDYHDSHKGGMVADLDRYRIQLLEAFHELHDSGYKIFIEPAGVPSSFKEKIFPIYQKTYSFDEQQMEHFKKCLLYLINEQFSPYELASSIDRLALLSTFAMFVNLNDLQILNIDHVQKFIPYIGKITDYLSHEVDSYVTAFDALTHVKQLPEYSKCIETFKKLQMILSDEMGIAFLDFLYYPENQQDLRNIMFTSADLTTVNKILDTHQNCVIYVGAGHILGIQTLLEKFGFTCKCRHFFIEPTNSSCAVEKSQLASNKTFVQQLICSYFDSECFTNNQLRKIPLLANFITSEHQLQKAIDFAQSDAFSALPVATQDKLAQLINASVSTHNELAQIFLTIDPKLFLHGCFESLQSKSEEECLIAQKRVLENSGLLSYVRIAFTDFLDSIELLYETVPGL